MKFIEMMSEGKLKVEIDKEEYMKNYQNNDNYTIDPPNATPDSAWNYYKTITDEQEKNTIINYKIYETLIKIKNIGLFFVLLALANIIATFILAFK